MTAERVIVTRPMVGICHMQVCTMHDATDEEILAVCNRENPSGTSNGWSTVIRATAVDETWGDTRPVACGSEKDRRHFLVSC